MTTWKTPSAANCVWFVKAFKWLLQMGEAIDRTNNIADECFQAHFQKL